MGNLICLGYYNKSAPYRCKVGLYEAVSTLGNDPGRMTGKPDVIPGEKFALPVTWVRGIKLRLFAFSSVAASHDSFATGLRSGRPIFVLPLLREIKTPGCPIQRVLENDFVVVTGTGTARDFIRLLTVELH